MKSLNAPTGVQEIKENYKWVRRLRTESPPGNIDDYLRSWESFFDHYASQVDHWHRRNAGYHRAIASLTRFYIPWGVRVLELGSGNGDLLAALNPSDGLGIDISGEMVRQASQKYPHLRFQKMSGERLALPAQKFDFIVLSDLVGYLYDIRLVFERLRNVCHSRTRLVINWYSRLWQAILGLAEKAELIYPNPLLN